MVRAADTAASSTTRASSNASCSWHLRQVVLQKFRVRRTDHNTSFVGQVGNLPPIVKSATRRNSRGPRVDNLYPAVLEIAGIARCYSGPTGPCNSRDHRIKLQDGKARSRTQS